MAKSRNGCVPITECPDGIDCGLIGDGCNGTLDCGSCPNSGDLCGAHDPNVCDPPTCRPLECYEINPLPQCGLVGNGCGDTMVCGSCAPDQICTVVGGVPNQCAGCVPKAQEVACAGLECGLVGDGCGGTLDCGTACPGGTGTSPAPADRLRRWLPWAAVLAALALTATIFFRWGSGGDERTGHRSRAGANVQHELPGDMRCAC